LRHRRLRRRRRLHDGGGVHARGPRGHADHHAAADEHARADHHATADEHAHADQHATADEHAPADPHTPPPEHPPAPPHPTPPPTTPPAPPLPPPPRAPGASGGVAVSPSPGGRLPVTISVGAPSCTADNRLQELRFTGLDNVSVEDLLGQGPITTPTTVPLPEQPVQVTFNLRRLVGGQAGTAHLVVRGRCGDWPAVRGGGPPAP